MSCKSSVPGFFLKGVCLEYVFQGVRLEHESYCGLGMGALVTVRAWNTNVFMIWAWML